MIWKFTTKTIMLLYAIGYWFIEPFTAEWSKPPRRK